MKLYYAWAEITGKVFVKEHEILYWFQENHPSELVGDSFSLVDDKLLKKAFEEIVQEKISELFHSDEPMKMNECIIDMDSFR